MLASTVDRISIVVNALHAPKANLSMLVTETGIVTVVNEVHP